MEAVALEMPVVAVALVDCLLVAMRLLLAIMPSRLELEARPVVMTGAILYSMVIRLLVVALAAQMLRMKTDIMEEAVAVAVDPGLEALDRRAKMAAMASNLMAAGVEDKVRLVLIPLVAMGARGEMELHRRSRERRLHMREVAGVVPRPLAEGVRADRAAVAPEVVLAPGRLVRTARVAEAEAVAARAVWLAGRASLSCASSQLM